MNQPLDERVALVTGAARGIGKACAMALSRDGATVVILDRLQEESNAVAKAICAQGGQAAAYTLDLAQAHLIPRVIQECAERFHRIDILVNNAGISPERPLEQITVEQWDGVMAINLRGVFCVTQAVLPLMRQRGSGAIVNVASIVARSGGINSTVDYTTSKAGVVGMTRVLARQYGADGIRVNAVAPGPILTDMIRSWPPERLRDLEQRIPLGRLGTPEEVADVIAFLAGPGARYLTGVTVDIAGGLYMS